MIETTLRMKVGNKSPETVKPLLSIRCHIIYHPLHCYGRQACYFLWPTRQIVNVTLRGGAPSEGERQVWLSFSAWLAKKNPESREIALQGRRNFIRGTDSSVFTVQLVIKSPSSPRCFSSRSTDYQFYSQSFIFDEKASSGLLSSQTSNGPSVICRGDLIVYYRRNRDQAHVWLWRESALSDI